MDHFVMLCEDDPSNPPQALLDRPRLTLEQEFYYEAFSDLSRSRSAGMASNPISMVDLFCYADRMGFRDIKTFQKVIRPLDEFYLKISAEKSAKK